MIEPQRLSQFTFDLVTRGLLFHHTDFDRLARSPTFLKSRGSNPSQLLKTYVVEYYFM